MGGQKQSLFVRMVTARNEATAAKQREAQTAVLLKAAQVSLAKANLHMKHGLPTRGIVYDAEQIGNMLRGTPELEAMYEEKVRQFGHAVLAWAGHFSVAAEQKPKPAELVETDGMKRVKPVLMFPQGVPVVHPDPNDMGTCPECGKSACECSLIEINRRQKAEGEAELEHRCVGCGCEVTGDADRQCVTCGGNADNHICCGQCPTPNLNQPVVKACERCGSAACECAGSHGAFEWACPEQKAAHARRIRSLRPDMDFIAGPEDFGGEDYPSDVSLPVLGVCEECNCERRKCECVPF
jgi:hypothetical protein